MPIEESNLPPCLEPMESIFYTSLYCQVFFMFCIIRAKRKYKKKLTNAKIYTRKEINSHKTECKTKAVQIYIHMTL